MRLTILCDKDFHDAELARAKLEEVRAKYDVRFMEAPSSFVRTCLKKYYPIAWARLHHYSLDTYQPVIMGDAYEHVQATDIFLVFYDKSSAVIDKIITNARRQNKPVIIVRYKQLAQYKTI